MSNTKSRVVVRHLPGAALESISHNANMPKRSPKTQRDYSHTWYLQEWMRTFKPARRQADMIRGLGWSRAKASDVYNSQRYTQDLIDELAPWLQVKPHELLMHPEEANQVRYLQRAIREAPTTTTAIGQSAEPIEAAPVEIPARRKRG